MMRGWGGRRSPGRSRFTPVISAVERGRGGVIMLEVLLGTRLMVGQQILDLYVGVRLLRPQPTV